MDEVICLVDRRICSQVPKSEKLGVYFSLPDTSAMRRVSRGDSPQQIDDCHIVR